MRKFFKAKLWLPLIILAFMAGYVVWDLHRAFPRLKATHQSAELQFSTPTAQISWPSAGQSAIGVARSNILLTNGDQKPVPTASTAKVITALMILRAKPLALGQTGPTITLEPSDVSLYQSYAGQDGSVVPVVAGEQITEYQMLEAMLLPSANNMADSLAIWAYGSLPAYKTAATSYVKQLGLNQTTIGSDASGFSPTTTSTARDLVRIGEIAMQNPVLAQIVDQKAAAGIPVAGTIKNINGLLGLSGIFGIKTGNNNQDQGVFMAAASTTVNQRPVNVITVLMNAPSLNQAMKDSLPLIESMEANFKPVTLISAGSIVGDYRAYDGTNLPVQAAQDLVMTTWNGAQLSGQVDLPDISSDSTTGQTISQLTVTDPITGNKKSVPLKLAGTPTKPTVWYRLLHP